MLREKQAGRGRQVEEIQVYLIFYRFLLLYWYQYISAGFSQVKVVIRCILRCQELDTIFHANP